MYKHYTELQPASHKNLFSLVPKLSIFSND